MHRTAAVALTALATACATSANRPALLPEPPEESAVAHTLPAEPPLSAAVLLGASVHRAGPGGPLVVEPAYLFAPGIDVASLGPALGRRRVSLQVLGGFTGDAARPVGGLGLSVCLTRPEAATVLQPRLTLGVLWEDPAQPDLMRGVLGLTVAR